MPAQSGGAPAEEAVDRTIQLPPFSVTFFTAAILLSFFAATTGGDPFILVPMAWAAAASFIVLVVLRPGSPANKRLGSYVHLAGALVVVAVLLSSGGIAYTYGAYGDLVAVASAEADPLDLSDGANHTVVFELKNQGPLAVRFSTKPYLDLELTNSSGERVPGFGCPGSKRSLTDRDVRELLPGGTFRYEVNGRWDGDIFPDNSSCGRWHMAAGETFYLYAIISGRAVSATLPVWVGSVESNRIAITT